MSLRYTIRVSKDHEQVTATWDIAVEMSDNELISSFTLTVDGKGLETQCSVGNKACKGAAYATLEKPKQDCLVGFVIATTKPDEVHGSDTLAGDRIYDDVTFSNSI